MDNSLNYEPYLYISKKNFIISVSKNLTNEIYRDELIINDNSNQINFEKLDFFLSTNIFKIEKKFSNFIKEISIILDLDVFLPIGISVKKNNYENLISSKDINHILYEIKDSCKMTIDDKKIIHMMINNYKVDNKDYLYLPENIMCDNFSLEVKLFCVSKELIRDFEKTLKKYHISLNQVLNANYIKSFFLNNEKDIFLMAKKIKNGYNQNEVMIVDKMIKNKGFFERFFNIFS